MAYSDEIRCQCGHKGAVHGNLVHFSECIIPDCDCLKFIARATDGNSMSTEDDKTDVEEISELSDADLNEFNDKPATRPDMKLPPAWHWAVPLQCEKCGHIYNRSQFSVCPHCDTDVLDVTDKKGLRSA